MSEEQSSELENPANQSIAEQSESFRFSRTSIEIISGILIAVIAFFIGTSTQHSKDVQNIKNYADILKNSFGSIATGLPTTPTQAGASDINSIGQPCEYDDGFSINVTNVEQIGNKVRVTFQVKNTGSQNIDLLDLETHYYYGSDGRPANVSTDYGMSSNPFVSDGQLTPSLTLTRDLEFSGSGITSQNFKIQVSGMQYVWKYNPCTFSSS